MVLRKENASTLTSMNNLALVLSKYEQAEEMHRQALGLVFIHTDKDEQLGDYAE
jgi:hypothetical protein